MSRGGVHYLKHAARRIGVSVDELIASAHVVRCTGCGSCYCDPWLSDELASALFCADAPDHIAGWAEFEHWLQGRSENVTQIRNQRLSASIARRIGPVASYAEFGCPFQGFLLHFRASETSMVERRSAFGAALSREPDPRWTRMARLHHRLQRLMSGAMLLALRADSLRRTTRESPAIGGGLPVPERRYLLTEDTTKGWGSNCVRYGATCQYFAHRVLGADVMPLHEVHRRDTPRFDLVGIFNSLDHTTFPVDVLRRSLDVAPHVVVVTHDVGHAGKQHLYGFTAEFHRWLPRAVPHVAVEDLQGEVDGDGHGGYGCFLLSRHR